jgi:hypothetical protein
MSRHFKQCAKPEGGIGSFAADQVGNFVLEEHLISTASIDKQ